MVKHKLDHLRWLIKTLREQGVDDEVLSKAIRYIGDLEHGLATRNVKKIERAVGKISEILVKVVR
ncbi:MAG TPA: hypothetical protein VD947_03635 [Patescibacteria group bacterium]|nr:hypothetical protein [Patescibacteria group bacterium]